MTKQYNLTEAILELKKKTGGHVSISAEINFHGSESSPTLKFVAYTALSGHTGEQIKLQDAVDEAIKLYKEKEVEQEISSDRFIIN